MLNTELQALRGADLNWAMMLRSVWENADSDVPELHAELRADFVHAIETLIASPASASPTGWVITGEGGSGKTHLLSQFRAECVRRNACFVLIDMTDVREFWETVANGYYHSLQQTLPDGTPQYLRLLSGMLSQVRLTVPVPSLIRKVRTLEASRVLKFSTNLLKALGAKYRAETVEHANIIRAIVGLSGGDIEIASIAGTWLMGEELDAAARTTLGLTKTQERGSAIVRGLSWLMSLAGFSVVALDQLDPIVTQLHLEKEALQSTPANAIINKLGMGLCELRDVTRRTLTVVSCLDRTWRALADYTPKQYADRYLPAKLLKPLQSEKVVESLILRRLRPAQRQAGFEPPYPTYPFRPAWFTERRLSSPREVLIACHKHISACLARGKVIEVPGDVPEEVEIDANADFARLDLRFLELRTAVDVAGVLSEPHEDDQFGGIIQAAVAGAVQELDPPSQVDVIAERTFTGSQGNPPLHARLRLAFHDESSREEHVCLRALQKKNSRAFATRLRSAITQAGIDKAIKFRQLFIIRRGPLPTGAMTSKLINEFERLGGQWLVPNDNDLRTLEALRIMQHDPDPHFAQWMKTRRHASRTALAQTTLTPLFNLLNGNRPPANQRDPASLAAQTASLFTSPTEPRSASTAPPASVTAIAPAASTDHAGSAAVTTERLHERTDVASERKPAPQLEPPASSPPPAQRPTDLLLGRRWIAGTISPQATTLPIAALQKHGIIFASAGSGKTVLLKRLIEGAALAGVPSIVIDCANDLASIGEAWGEPPAQWGPEDAALAAQFQHSTERILWTPNKESGNPLGLEPLPDLTALASDAEEFSEAVTMAVDAMMPVAGTGSASKANKKKAILTRAFEYLGHNGNCNLDGLVDVLRDLPSEATAHISQENKIAAEMADDLSAQLTINPLLRSQGPVLDPAVLLGGRSGKTRISVISLVGLAALEEQRHFLNQLAMILFTWIKRNPKPADLPLRGLLVIDETRDFFPSGRASACLASMQRLSAQARKYGLGLILATQNPKDIDNKIVGQCSTHWYGKMASPAAIDAAAELLKARGARSGDDVGSLKAGTFYVSNADHISPPIKLAVPMSLSEHAGPMTPDVVVRKAAASRAMLKG